jgi:hypothetical protein
LDCAIALYKPAASGNRKPSLSHTILPIVRRQFGGSWKGCPLNSQSGHAAAVPAQPAKKACKYCGHWSNSPEFGMDFTSGYCEVWEKLTSADFVCDQFIERTQLRKEQAALYSQMGDEGEEYEE